MPSCSRQQNTALQELAHSSKPRVWSRCAQERARCGAHHTGGAWRAPSTRPSPSPSASHLRAAPARQRRRRARTRRRRGRRPRTCTCRPRRPPGARAPAGPRVGRGAVRPTGLARVARPGGAEALFHARATIEEVALGGAFGPQERHVQRGGPLGRGLVIRKGVPVLRHVTLQPRAFQPLPTSRTANILGTPSAACRRCGASSRAVL